MTALFERAGLDDVEEWDVPTTMSTDSPEQYWQLLTELTAPVVDTLARVDADRAADRRDGRRARHARSNPEASCSIPGKARCVVGTKAPR